MPVSKSPLLNLDKEKEVNPDLKESENRMKISLMRR